MKNLICSAINEKKLLRFFYDGGFRVVEPHCFGEGTKGTDLLRAYQVKGYSSSGNPFGWRLFDISEITALTVLEDTFDKARRDYNPNDSAMVLIYCRIPKS